jgi:hypothetical protein
MRFWLIELPALIVTLLFKAYMVFIAAMTLVCFVLVAWALTFGRLGLPSLW